MVAAFWWFIETIHKSIPLKVMKNEFEECYPIAGSSNKSRHTSRKTWIIIRDMKQDINQDMHQAIIQITKRRHLLHTTRHPQISRYPNVIHWTHPSKSNDLDTRAKRTANNRGSGSVADPRPTFKRAKLFKYDTHLARLFSSMTWPSPPLYPLFVDLNYTVWFVLYILHLVSLISPTYDWVPLCREAEGRRSFLIHR